MKKLPTNWEEVCKINGMDTAIPFDVSMLSQEMQNYMIASYKLPHITKALNGDWKPDYTNLSQPKYEPWFKVHADSARPSGFGLSYGDYVSWTSYSYVGVRLCFKSREVMLHACEYFKSEYEHHHLIIS